MSSALPPPASSALSLRANRATFWQLRTRRLAFGRRPMLMGILNVTPDSFSDGGRFVERDAAIEQGLRLAAEGADILDVGGESTRPYSEAVDTAEELARVMPVIRGLVPRLTIPLSIDTSKAEVAREAIGAGAEIINDITALSGDPQMIDVARGTGAGTCLMHMQGRPQTMQDDPQYRDVVAEVLAFLRARREALLAEGIDATRIALDPGIGFGKTHAHNVTLLAHCRVFHELGCPLLVGHSRKAFIGKVLGDKSVDPAAGTIGASLALAGQGVQVLRVHDVAAVRQALVLFEAAGGLGDTAGVTQLPS